jgi:hypothetical protein
VRPGHLGRDRTPLNISYWLAPDLPSLWRSIPKTVYSTDAAHAEQSKFRYSVKGRSSSLPIRVQLKGRLSVYHTAQSRARTNFARVAAHAACLLRWLGWALNLDSTGYYGRCAGPPANIIYLSAPSTYVTLAVNDHPCQAAAAIRANGHHRPKEASSHSALHRIGMIPVHNWVEMVDLIHRHLAVGGFLLQGVAGWSLLADRQADFIP